MQKTAQSTIASIEVFQAHNIRYFFYNGGGDSQDTANKVSQLGARLGYPLQCIGAEDSGQRSTGNGLLSGFGSVAKYVAVSTKEAALDIESMCATSTKVFVLEVMGRHAGWIAAAGALARDQAGDPPHIILLPRSTLQSAAIFAPGEGDCCRKRVLRCRRFRGR